MMNAHLQQRFDQLLDFIKDRQLKSLTGENIAAAKELVETVMSCGLLLPDEYRAYHAQIDTAKLVAGAQQLRRESDRRQEHTDVRPAVAEDGAYRFNPLAGHHE